MTFVKQELIPKEAKYKTYDGLDKPLRVLGAGVWTAEFEALAFAQYQERQEHWIS